MNGISALLKDLREQACSFCQVRTQQKMAVCESEGGPSLETKLADVLIWTSQPP